MAKDCPVKHADSTHSIDISKHDGVSYLWNLFSKNNKNEKLHNATNREEPKLKHNSVAMNLLKLRGVDLEQLERFDKTDYHPSTEKNKTVIINPKQKMLNKRNLPRKNNLKDIHNFKENFKSLSTTSINSKKSLINYNMAYLRSKKSKENAIKNNNKETNKLNEKDNNAINMPASPEIQNVLFKALPGKDKKSKHKRVLVPVYIGKKRSSKSSDLKKETLFNENGKSNPFYMGSEIKTRPMEGHLKNLECKTNKNKDAVSWKTLLQVSSLPPKSNNLSKHFHPNAGTLITNRVEEENNYGLTKLQLGKKVIGNILAKKTVEKHNKNHILPNYDNYVNTKKEEKSKKRIDNFRDMFYNSDFLIKNHNLIVPTDISQQGMFQANPDAGCDTILKVFNLLSEGNDCRNQPKTTLTTKGHGENDKEDRNISDYHLEIRSLAHGDGQNTITAHGNLTNINRADGMNTNHLNTYSDKRINTNELRNIFSLPVNLNILKTLRENKSNETNRSLKKSKSEVDGLTKSLNNIEEENPCINVYKEEPIFHTDQVSKKSEISVQNLTDRHNIEKGGDSNEFFREAPEISKLTESKSSMNSLNEIINTSNHQLQNSSPAFEEELVRVPNTNISVGKISGNDECSIDMLRLNISHEECEVPGVLKQSQKLFKKTTISCPIKMADQKVSITILIENNLENEKNLLRDVNPNLENHSICQFSEIINSKVSLDLENIHSGKEHVSEETVQVTEKHPFIIGSLYHTEASSLSKRRETDTTISSTGNEQFMIKCNNGNKTDRFGLIKCGTYLTQKQRKVFDEEVLGVDYYEKSINLSNLKLTCQNKQFVSDVKHRPGLIKVLSESSVDSHESNTASQHKLNTLYTRKILHRSGRYYLRNPFYMESLSLKKQSKTMVSKEEYHFRKNTKTNNPNACLSLNETKLSSSSSSNEKNYNDDHQHLEPQLKHCFTSPKCTESSIDIKKKLCRFSLTLNHEPVMKHYNFLKISEGDEQTEENKTVDINHIEVGNCRLNTMNGISNDGLQHFKDYDIKRATKYKRKQSVQPDFNVLENSQVSFHSFNAKLDVAPVKETSTIDKRSLETFSSVGSEIKNNHLGSELKSFQYKTKGSEIQSDYSSNHNYELKPDKNFQHDTSTEVLLCGIKNENPQLISYKIIKTLSSHSTSKEADQESILENNHEENEINPNNKYTKPCNCCNVSCLTVISEESLNDDYLE